MSHIHLPDGILPVWLWGAGYVILTIYIIFAAFYFRNNEVNKKMALTGILAAIMLVVMSIEIIPPVYHVNLAVFSGIVLGPVLSALAIFIVNVILAFLGHGGVTVVALNTVIVSIEAIVGYFGFKLLKSRIKNIFITAFSASIIALIISAFTTVGTVYLGTNDSDYLQHTQEHHHNVADNHNIDHNQNSFDIKRFILLVLSFGVIGWTVEALITAFIVNYISKIKPDILDDRSEVTT